MHQYPRPKAGPLVARGITSPTHRARMLTPSPSAISADIIYLLYSVFFLHIGSCIFIDLIPKPQQSPRNKSASCARAASTQQEEMRQDVAINAQRCTYVILSASRRTLPYGTNAKRSSAQQRADPSSWALSTLANKFLLQPLRRAVPCHPSIELSIELDTYSHHNSLHGNQLDRRDREV